LRIDSFFLISANCLGYGKLRFRNRNFTLFVL